MYQVFTLTLLCVSVECMHIGRKYVKGNSPAECAQRLLKDVETKLPTMAKVINHLTQYMEKYALKCDDDDLDKCDKKVKEKVCVMNDLLKKIRVLVDTKNLRTSFEMNPLANIQRFAKRIDNLRVEFEEQIKNKLELAAQILRRETPLYRVLRDHALHHAVRLDRVWGFFETERPQELLTEVETILLDMGNVTHHLNHYMEEYDVNCDDDDLKKYEEIVKEKARRLNNILENIRVSLHTKSLRTRFDQDPLVNMQVFVKRIEHLRDEFKEKIKKKLDLVEEKFGMTLRSSVMRDQGAVYAVALDRIRGYFDTERVKLEEEVGALKSYALRAPRGNRRY